MSDFGSSGGPVETAARRTAKPRDSEVLETAIKVFHARGFEGASVQAIADELGILKGSLYHYISSKADLLYELLKSVHDDQQILLRNVETMGELPPADRLYWYVRRQVEYAVDHLREIAIYYNDFDHLPAPQRQIIVGERDIHEAFVANLVVEAQAADPNVSDDSAGVLTNLIFGSFIWTYRWYKPSDQLSRAEFAVTCARFAVRSIGASTSPDCGLDQPRREP